MKALRTIILAAGKGTRMKSSLPKVLHKVCGQPMIHYVVDTAVGAGSSKTYVVLGHKSQAVESCLSGGVVCVEQKKLLGTADAVRTCENYFRSYNGEILIMCGDAPLLSKSTIRALVRKHKRSNSVCTFLTAVLHDPQGYGRVIRGDSGDVQLIREDKDAVGFERDIAEINVGVYCVGAKELFKVLREIKVNKKKGEFYLTDIIEAFSQKGLKVDSLELEDPQEGRGINTREDLSLVERQMRRKIAKELMLSGVSIIDPQTTYIDADVKIGKDTEIYPFTYIEGNVS
ncbi:N-acetylglucosamine-1-phosphate uridyltransferase / Glucosamine-1-phosphate N-acetyltransferase, partial [hydrothermal vent metagenome]